MAAIRRDKGTGERPRWVPSLGRWRARYIDADGKRRSVYSPVPGRAGAREAAAKRDEAIRRAELGIVHNPRLTVGDLLERWLSEVAPLRLADFHGNPITGSTAIRSAVPRVSDHPRMRPLQR